MSSSSRLPNSSCCCAAAAARCDDAVAVRCAAARCDDVVALPLVALPLVAAAAIVDVEAVARRCREFVTAAGASEVLAWPCRFQGP